MADTHPVLGLPKADLADAHPDLELPHSGLVDAHPYLDCWTNPQITAAPQEPESGPLRLALRLDPRQSPEEPQRGARAGRGRPAREGRQRAAGPVSAARQPEGEAVAERTRASHLRAVLGPGRDRLRQGRGLHRHRRDACAWEKCQFLERENGLKNECSEHGPGVRSERPTSED